MTVKKQLLLFLTLFIFHSLSTHSLAQNTFSDSVSKSVQDLSYQNKIQVLQETTNRILQTDPQNALLLSEKMRDLAFTQKDFQVLYQAYFNLGRIYSYYSEYQASLNNHIQALKTAQDLDIDSLIIPSYNEIALLYVELDDLGKAFENLEKAQDLATKDDNRLQLIQLDLTLGELYLYQKNYEKAIEVLNQASDLSLEIKDTLHYSISNSNLASVYNQQENYLEALFFARKALNLLDSLNHPQELIPAYRQMGIGLVGLVRLPEATSNFEKALRFAQSLQNKKALSELYLNLSEVYELQNKTDSAFVYFKRHKMYNDSLYKENEQAQMAKMHSLYQLEEKERSIQVQKEETKFQTFLRNTVIIALLVILLGVYFLVRSFLKQRKQNAKLEEKNLEIQEKNKQINSIKDSVERRNIILARKNEEIEKKTKNLTDSLNYAQRIQDAMLPADDYFLSHLPESFVFLRPREVVSGDFYWLSKKNHKYILAAADCTGHGVPGAFMSMIGNNLFHEIVQVKGIIEPAAILQELNRGIQRVLKQQETKNQDGMDIALCVIDTHPIDSNNFLETPKLHFSGAHNPLVYFQNNELHVLKGEKTNIGGYKVPENQEFEQHTVELNTDTQLYIYSDGLQDQFGGEKGRRFSKKRLHKLLEEIHLLPMNEQKKILDETMNEWMRSEKASRQMDDMLLIGVNLNRN